MGKFRIFKTILFSIQSLVMYIGIFVIIFALILWYLNIKSFGPIIGVLLGSGIAIFTNGLFELARYASSTTILKLEGLDLEIFTNSYRVSALVKNIGNTLVEHAKGVLTLQHPPQRELSKIIVPSCDACELKNKCPVRSFLANRINPAIRGCSLAWGLPEKPIPRPTKLYIGKEYLKRLAETLKLKSPTLDFIIKEIIKLIEDLNGLPLYYFTDYTHITSIAPHEIERLMLFDFVPLNNGRYIIRLYSEYGGSGFADPCPRPYRACLYIDKKQN